MDTNKTLGEKNLTAITQECCKQYWTSPGSNIPRSCSCTATNLPSRKLSKLDEPDMQNTDGGIGTNSLSTYSCEPLYIDEQRQGDQLEPPHNSSEPIQDVDLKTYRERWMIKTGGERGSGRSVLAARHDDDFYLFKKFHFLFLVSFRFWFYSYFFIFLFTCCS